MSDCPHVNIWGPLRATPTRYRDDLPLGAGPHGGGGAAGGGPEAGEPECAGLRRDDRGAERDGGEGEGEDEEPEALDPAGEDAADGAPSWAGDDPDGAVPSSAGDDGCDPGADDGRCRPRPPRWPRWLRRWAGVADGSGEAAGGGATGSG